MTREELVQGIASGLASELLGASVTVGDLHLNSYSTYCDPDGCDGEIEVEFEVEGGGTCTVILRVTDVNLEQE